ncbi:hypothetical protein Pfo_007652 [Paulownia fortunei]|nr:hypothetical protein Pfo_007652 [Paulownia fortunei]
MVVSFSSMPPTSSIFEVYASILAFIMLVQIMLNQLVPRQVQHYVLNIIKHYFKPRPNNATIVIEERDGMLSNEVYSAAEIYLCTKIRPNIERLKISKSEMDTSLSIRFAKCEKIADCFEGIDLEWRFVNEERGKTSKVLESENRYFELCFDKKHADKVLDSYVPFVLERAKFIRAEKKVVKLHTLACASSIVWYSINLEHPSTFDTLAMEPRQKKSIIEDLDRFVRRKEFYRKVGRAWKRGYLLYGPPGTGKSSLIAAMANYLKFDIYDLDLTNVKRDSDFRKLLLRTENRSILVIEDIDCTVELPDRKGRTSGPDGHGHSHRPHDHQVTLSGFLNFVDGLWSSCGDERIIIFTTNHVEKLDPALFRPGRMDVHINMSYCTPCGFKLLASNYLGIKDHVLFKEIEDSIRIANVTPAEVAEQLLKNDDPDAAIQGIIDFINTKIKENRRLKLKREKQNQLTSKKMLARGKQLSKENEEAASSRAAAAFVEAT